MAFKPGAMVFKPGDGRKTVTTAGTAERLVDAPTICLWVDIQSLRGNAVGGYVAVGAETVVAADGTERGAILGPETPIRITARPGGVIDLYDIWIDVVTSGEGVNFLYGT